LIIIDLEGLEEGLESQFASLIGNSKPHKECPQELTTIDRHPFQLKDEKECLNPAATLVAG
jgi:hypothetical protein